MSEIKGQLLGIILVLMIFATITVSMRAVFGKLTSKIDADVAEIVTVAPTSGSKSA